MYEYTKRIGFSEIGQDRKMTIVSLINLLQDTCTFQSEDCGYPLERMMERNMGWFILTWHIKIKELPKMGDIVSSKTWPNRFNGLLAGRNFTVEKDGEIIVTADSNWVLMDTKNLKPLRIPEEMKRAYGFSDPLPGEWIGRKLKEKESYDEVFSFTVGEMHLDTNHHMNNSYYALAALLARDKDETDKKIREIKIEYRNQAVLNDTVHVKRNGNDFILCTDKVLSIVETV